MAEYDINYDDARFKEVEADKSAALNEMEKTYAGMINDSDKYFQDQIDAQKQWGDKQQQLQQEQTDFTIEKIEQQKEQARKDYLKEQSGAYVDWRKQSNQYGTEAEQMASSGLANTGFSESSQVSMYNTYQNRVATARESITRAFLNYDNAIKDARLQGNAAMAEIALQTYIKQTELALQGFQYKNNLILEQANKKLEVENIYHDRYQDVLKQINTENALAEEIRQYNEQMALEREQFEWQKAQAKKASSSKKSSKKSSSGGGKGNTGVVTDNTDTTETGSSSGLVVANSPLTAEGAAKGVAEGKYNAKVVGKTIYLSNNPDYVAGQSTFDKYASLMKAAITKTKKSGGGGGR